MAPISVRPARRASSGEGESTRRGAHARKDLEVARVDRARIPPREGRFYGRIVTVSAGLERSSRDHCVELVANVGRGNVLVASVHRDGLRSALDDAVHTLQRRLSKHHDEVELKRRRRRS